MCRRSFSESEKNFFSKMEFLKQVESIGVAQNGNFDRTTKLLHLFALHNFIFFKIKSVAFSNTSCCSTNLIGLNPPVGNWDSSQVFVNSMQSELAEKVHFGHFIETATCSFNNIYAFDSSCPFKAVFMQKVQKVTSVFICIFTLKSFFVTGCRFAYFQ